MTKIHSARFPGLCSAAIVLAGAMASSHAQAVADSAATVNLETIVVTATRTPVSLAHLASAASVVTAADLAARQQYDLLSLFSTEPGLPTGTTGQAGGVTSLFTRGSNSNHTLFLVDGIRFSDANTEYFNLLGGSSIGAYERVEIVRGPQSTLHGGEALGGVIAINQVRGSGPHSGALALEGGSFGTVEGSVAAQGGEGANAYSFSLAAGRTENDRPDNAFAHGNFALRLDHDLSATARIGATVRGYQGRYESPGDRYTNDPNNSDNEHIALLTVFTELEPTPDWAIRATLGYQHRRLVADNPLPNPPWGDPAAHDHNTTKRTVLDAQATWTGCEGHRVTFGSTAEKAATRNTGFGNIDEQQTVAAFFVQDEITLRDGLYLTLGLRNDDHDTFGNATTGRAALAWVAQPDRLKFRASYGTAFRSPSFLDLYGTNAFYVGNPNLDPEEAKGWDTGVDFTLPDSRGKVSVTWFDTRFDNLINYDFMVFPSTVRNVGKARTHGLETTVRLNFTKATQLEFAHTWLEADDLTANVRLLRRPRHSVGANLRHDFEQKFTLGTGMTWVADREDVDAATYATIDAENYLLLRVYAAWRLQQNLDLRIRVENALNKTYEAVNGFPSPGLAVYGGFDWRF
ncbi:MAG: TonB-dependent receptor [Opitutaceae bacterium]|nr:TonB-dependent receptor [Opitutaceae bacterium]MBP9913764.1 TonB-dependent receptor [Opitutaceae bacterium]